MTLQELDINQIALVEAIQTEARDERFKIRLEAMGMTPGKPIRVLRSAILGGPLQVRVGSTTEIAIRRSEASLVKVTTTA
ncbi:MAG: ferrous iron transport protein A [Gloeocapsa sp. DLM2.Bin57]|nr:MAG: ferrous iron transport protein A [Gloeocapsa sp. DLM2.Bin57]